MNYMDKRKKKYQKTRPAATKERMSRKQNMNKHIIWYVCCSCKMGPKQRNMMTVISY